MKKKSNIFTLAYNGFLAIIYSILGKKTKIDDLFLDPIEKVNLSSNEIISGVFVDRNAEFKKQREETLDLKKKTFRYKAKNRQNRVINSTFDAYTIEQAKKFLSEEGLTIVSIKECGKLDFNIGFGSVISISELAFALTQLSTYIKAGISIVDSVRILAKQTTKVEKKKVYEVLIYDLLGGDSFSDALEKQKKTFPKLLINMVRSAELTGDLPAVLDDMSAYYTSISKTRKEIKSAMTYPIVVMSFSILVVAFVLIWVVPQYQSMFEGQGLTLPGITTAIISLSDFLQKNWLILIIGICLFILIFYYLYKNIRSFKKKTQTILLHFPVAKNVIMYGEISMFTKTFASLLNHGVHITDSMDVLLKVSDNEVYRSIIMKTVENLNAGGKVSDSFKDNWAIPIVAYEMIVTGESTGQLGSMMEKVSTYYDSLHTNTISQLKSLIEPILIVFLAGSVGVIILSIILPMFQMYQSLS